MVNKFNKKASMELSLNLIIMLVIGLTVLGLVIGMVTGLLGSATNKIKDKLDDTQAAEKEAVLGKPGFFAVGPEKVRIPLSGNKKIFIKITNRASLKMVFPPIPTGQGTTTSTSFASTLTLTSSVIGTGSCALSYFSTSTTILPQETQVITVGIEPGTGCLDGQELFININFKDSAGTAFDETRTINAVIEG